MNNKAMTLAELIVVLSLICILSLAVYSVYLIFLTSFNFDVERYTMSGEVSYALSDMKIRCLSASQVKADSLFDSEGGEKEMFDFIGEMDIYNITPDDTSDNVDYYSYYIRDNGDLVLENKTDGKIDVLVEGKYKPEVEFTYTPGDEPDFMTVSVSATGNKNFGNDTPKVIKTEGIRFWFADVVR